MKLKFFYLHTSKESLFDNKNGNVYGIDTK